MDGLTDQRDKLAHIICLARHYPIRDLSDEELADALIKAGVRVERDDEEPSEAQIERLYGGEQGGDSPSYRSDMKSAGRGHLLR